ncbi:hypothetical protein EVAR_80668_1 [Eumeta japonica]|uniref:Uncharacterized protein n=1 Tax=Eumeta variegata TaxID=151549 RepID=A0A4C1U3H1_EUMVA|nr:hypothetical protein EVAR_80668_1 [Eumeta japonica]
MRQNWGLFRQTVRTTAKSDAFCITRASRGCTERLVSVSKSVPRTNDNDNWYLCRARPAQPCRGRAFCTAKRDVPCFLRIARADRFGYDTARTGGLDYLKRPPARRRRERANVMGLLDKRILLRSTPTRLVFKPRDKNGLNDSPMSHLSLT